MWCDSRLLTNLGRITLILDLSLFWLIVAVLVSPFWLVAVLTCRRFDLSPFWFVAVLTCRRFGVAVLTCRRFDHRPVPSYHTRLDAAFFCLHSLLLDSSSAAVPRKLSDSSPWNVEKKITKLLKYFKTLFEMFHEFFLFCIFSAWS